MVVVRCIMYAGPLKSVPGHWFRIVKGSQVKGSKLLRSWHTVIAINLVEVPKQSLSSSKADRAMTRIMMRIFMKIKVAGYHHGIFNARMK
ncbi:hypothetical protein PIB30_030770 [Stylosanthes scabra]|uniref:Uncharacterized protein n=1 Tax=Stylosanthes scabra TaxID=79078 RepID=A0ABU6YE35_9FABA|nr:hypothetical protein [Stylosanthes scabra]